MHTIIYTNKDFDIDCDTRMGLSMKKRSPFENLISFGIVIILTAIGTGVFFSQYQLNPAVTAVPDLTPATENGSEAATQQHYFDAEELETQLMPISSAEFFTPETLSDKINGKAELYLSAGFKALQTQRFAVKESAEMWMELFLYDMGDARNAFAVYSSQRRDGASDVPLGRYAYQTENAVFISYGRYYIEIIAATTANRSRMAMHDLVPVLKKVLGPVVERPSEQAFFPVEDRVDNSIKLLAKDVFGYAALDQVYIALYTIEGQEMTAFVSLRDSASDAEKLAKGYADYLKKFGGKRIQLDEHLPDTEMIDIMEMYEIIIVRGPYLIGVHEAESTKTAQHLASRLAAHLEIKTK